MRSWRTISVHVSQVIKKTLEPAWNEQFMFEGLKRDIMNDMIVLEVFDKDLVGKDDPLGDVAIPMGDVPNGGGEFNLMLPTQGHLFVHVVWAHLGMMHEVSDSAIDDEIEVKVMLKRAKGLLAADKGGTSDPYVRATLLRKSQKTQAVKKTLEPSWNQELKFSGVKTPMLEAELRLEVYDADLIGKDDPLGEVRIKMSEVRRECRRGRLRDRRLHPHS